MATMNMSVSHRLAEAEALKRTKKLLSETKKHYGDLVTDLKESWRGNVGSFSFKVKGFALAGTITIDSEKVVLQGELPLMLSFMKGKIEETIRAHARELLA